jgi:putative methionine-R-sulfoxide reductase with GAF domain
MIALLKDRYKMGLLLATVFFIGIIASIYSLYALPYNLMMGDVLHPAFTSTYIILALTFLAGGFAIWYALQHTNEIIVYRDKQIETTTNESTTTSNQTTISLESVRSAIRQDQDIEKNLQAGLQAVCRELDAGQGAAYLTVGDSNGRKVVLKSGYALTISENTVISYSFGEGLVGQAAAGARTLYVDEVPDGYIKIISGLGSASPKYLLIVPIKNKGHVLGVMEIASFTPISEDQRKFVEESAQLIAGTVSGN